MKCWLASVLLILACLVSSGVVQAQLGWLMGDSAKVPPPSSGNENTDVTNSHSEQKGLGGSKDVLDDDLRSSHSDAGNVGMGRTFYNCGISSCESASGETMRLAVNTDDMTFQQVVVRLPLKQLGNSPSRLMHLNVVDFSPDLRNSPHRLLVCREDADMDNLASTSVSSVPSYKRAQSLTCDVVQLSALQQGDVLCASLARIQSVDSMNLDLRLILRPKIDHNMRSSKSWIQFGILNNDENANQLSCSNPPVHGDGTSPLSGTAGAEMFTANNEVVDSTATASSTNIKKHNTVTLVRASADTFVRGGDDFSKQNFGGEGEIPVKTNVHLATERIGIVSFRPTRPDSTVTLLLTVHDGKFTGHNSQELALCRHDALWAEKQLTYDTFISDTRHCLYVPLSTTTNGAQLCTTVPAQFMRSEDGNYNFEMIMTSNIQSGPTSEGQSSHDWISFYSREQTFYEGPTIVHGANACSTLGLAHSESLLRVEDCRFTNEDHTRDELMKHQRFEQNVCYAPLDMIDVVTKFNKGKTALMYTPYDLSIGGGEKYFLEVVSFLIGKGYQVILSTHDTNYCQDKQCVLRTAFALRVHIPGDFKYLPVSYRALKRLHATRFDVYYEMGNTRFPEFRNPAVLGMYQCQFPFDLDGPFSEQSVFRLSTFNLVIVNSRFTQSWYIKYSTPALKVMEDKNMRYPAIEVVYPPVELVTEVNPDIFTHDPKKVSIVQLGRIFSGRQSKGHQQAIAALIALNAEDTDDVEYELNIIGNIHPRFEAYAQSLQKQAEGHAVKFHFGVSGDTLMQLLDEGDMIWHLTGVDIAEENSDPASYEHFGISVVEGMSHGLVPIIYNQGGVTEIPGGFGYEISDEGGLVNTTRLAAGGRLGEQSTKAMIAHVQQFNKPAFVKRMSLVLDRAQKSLYFNAVQLPRLPFTCAKDLPVDNSAIGTAFIFIHSPGWHIKMILRNTLYMLGPNWKLAIAFPTYLEDYVQILINKLALGRRYSQAKLLPLNIQVSNSDAYSFLLMSKSFWEELASPYVLVFQSDSVLLRRPRSLDSLRDVTYVGAPWCPSNGILKTGVAEHPVGNGGLSLRSSFFMVKCIESLDVKQAMEKKRELMRQVNMSFVTNNEDIFFSTCMSTLLQPSQVKMALDQSKEFAVEVNCGEPLATPPDGLHASWYYHSRAEINEYVDNSRAAVEATAMPVQACDGDRKKITNATRSHNILRPNKFAATGGGGGALRRLDIAMPITLAYPPRR